MASRSNMFATLADSDNEASPKSTKAPKVLTEEQRAAKAAKEAARRQRKKEAAAQYADPLMEERQALLSSVSKKLNEISAYDEMSGEDLLANEVDLRRSLDDLLAHFQSELDRLCVNLPRPDKSLPKMKLHEMKEHIQRLANLPEKDVVVIDHLREQLKLHMSIENGKNFMTDAAPPLLEKIKRRQQQLTDLVSAARSDIRNAKTLQRVKALLSLAEGQSFEHLTMDGLSVVEMELTTALALMGPPNNFARRIERTFKVAVDRHPSNRRSYIFAGRPADVDRAVAFMNSADFTGDVTVKLADPKLLGQVIGRGGAGIRQLESEYNCFLEATGADTIIIYGAKADAEKVSAHLKALKLEVRERKADQVETIKLDHGALARSLSSTFGRAVRDAESKYNVNVWVAYGDWPGVTDGSNEKGNAGVGAAGVVGFGKDISETTTTATTVGGKASGSNYVSSGQLPSISVRAPGVRENADVPAARKELEAFVGTLRVLEVDAGSMEPVLRLFSRVSSTGEIDLTAYNSRSLESPQAALSRPVGDRFCDLVASAPNVAFIRWGTKVALVGTPENIAAVEPSVRELVEVAGYTSVRIPLTAAQVVAFSQRRIASISEATEAQVALRKGRGEEAGAFIEVLASDEKKQKAVDMVKEIIKNEACVAVVALANQGVLDELLARRATAVRDLESKFGTRISVARSDKTCTITGSEKGVASTQKALEEIEERLKNTVTVTVPIPSSDMVGRLIGTKGANINNIREKSKVLSIDIKDEEKVVLLRGPKDAVEIARKMVDECFSAGGENSNNAARGGRRNFRNDANNENGFAPAPAATTVVAAPQSAGLGWGESIENELTFENSSTAASTAVRGRSGWNSVSAAPAAASASNNEGFFPSLDEAVVSPSSKGRRAAVRARVATTTDEEVSPTEA